jgi:uncharacterized membrane protein YuzA (DUF378 family)
VIYPPTYPPTYIPTYLTTYDLGGGGMLSYYARGCVSSVVQDLTGVKETTTRKASSIWKLLMLLVVGLCGVYVCMIGVDNRPAFQQFPRKTVFQVKQQQEEHVTKCPKLLKSHTFTEHYPHPNTFDRCNHQTLFGTFS